MTNQKPVRLTSLLLIEERLLEAEYFVRRLTTQHNSDRFGYELNAFLSAARSVTFLLQKELAKVDGFTEWWQQQRDKLSCDEAARFFLELRNFSQKQGRISLVGYAFPSTGRHKRWRYRFAGTVEPVPNVLLNRDVADCCREHLAKLAAIVLQCTEAFPYHCSPRQALTPEGINALSIDLDAIDAALGFPPGSSTAGAGGDRLRRVAALREHMDGLDFTALKRVASLKPRVLQSGEGHDLGEDFADALVRQIENRRHMTNPADPAIGAAGELILRHIAQNEKP